MSKTFEVYILNCACRNAILGFPLDIRKITNFSRFLFLHFEGIPRRIDFEEDNSYLFYLWRRTSCLGSPPSTKTTQKIININLSCVFKRNLLLFKCLFGSISSRSIKGTTLLYKLLFSASAFRL